MKKVFFIAIYILTFVVMIGTMRILFHTGKEVENIVQINVIDAKYDNGFIVIELQNSEDNYNLIERYDISEVKIINIENEKPYLKKYFNKHNKVVYIELFYNDSLI